MSPPLALQLYTLRDALAVDYEGVIRKVASFGYAGVEPAGMFGSSLESAAALFKELGLQVPSMHTPPPIGDQTNSVLDTASALGVRYVVVPYIPPDQFKTVDQVKAQCDRLNEANANARARGFTLLYHNHWWEFETADALGGKTPFALMLEQLDPTIGFEIDTYWVKTAGADPATTVRDLGSRAPLLHIKDGVAKTDQPMLAVGTGVMDFKAISAVSSADWWIVELDRCATDMLTAVEQSYAYLTQAGLAHGR